MPGAPKLSKILRWSKGILLKQRSVHWHGLLSSSWAWTCEFVCEQRECVCVCACVWTNVYMCAFISPTTCLAVDSYSWPLFLRVLRLLFFHKETCLFLPCEVCGCFFRCLTSPSCPRRGHRNDSSSCTHTQHRWKVQQPGVLVLAN